MYRVPGFVFLLRVVFFALVFGRVLLAIDGWIGYNLLIKKRSKKTGDKPPIDNQEPVQSWGQSYLQDRELNYLRIGWVEHYPELATHEPRGYDTRSDGY